MTWGLFSLLISFLNLALSLKCLMIYQINCATQREKNMVSFLLSALMSVFHKYTGGVLLHNEFEVVKVYITSIISKDERLTEALKKDSGLMCFPQMPGPSND